MDVVHVGEYQPLDRKLLKEILMTWTRLIVPAYILVLRKPLPFGSCLLSLKSRRRLFNWKIKMGLWTLFQGFLLLANAFAVLNEDRFLAPKGWTLMQIQGGRTSVKGQIIGFINACQFFRLPLIIMNIVTIFVKLISG